jgi:hypothetical protein
MNNPRAVASETARLTRRRNQVKKSISQERVLARALAEKELKSAHGGDVVVVTTPEGGRRDITDSNNGDIAQ